MAISTRQATSKMRQRSRVAILEVRAVYRLPGSGGKTNNSSIKARTRAVFLAISSSSSSPPSVSLFVKTLFHTRHIEGVDGKPDILVNNAGIGGSLRDPDFTAKKFAATDPFEPETANLDGHLCTQHHCAILHSHACSGDGFCSEGHPDSGERPDSVFASQLVSPEVLDAIKTKPLLRMVAPIPRRGKELRRRWACRRFIRRLYEWSGVER
ncbi:hypothetical protein EDD85DRAFT_963686 [Armillaria nabsnona]|nr:hypothetical protein EDD85DRAFT_963686 [Armillaria nabsnona]